MWCEGLAEYSAQSLHEGTESCVARCNPELNCEQRCNDCDEQVAQGRCGWEVGLQLAQTVSGDHRQHDHRQANNQKFQAVACDFSKTARCVSNTDRLE